MVIEIAEAAGRKHSPALERYLNAIDFELLILISLLDCQ